MRIIFLGPPGAGKGTQAKRAMGEFQLEQVSTGDMLRAAKASGSTLGQEAARYMDAGQLVPDQVVIGLIDERLNLASKQTGFIFDGFPRTLPQAEALDELLSSRDEQVDAVVNIQVPDEDIVQRLSLRRSCPSCGEIYHLEFFPPSQEDVCDKCGHAGLFHRADDQPEAIGERLEVYHSKTAPLIGYYEKRGRLRNIDGTGSADEVFSNIKHVLSTINREKQDLDRRKVG